MMFEKAYCAVAPTVRHDPQADDPRMHNQTHHESD